MSLKFCGLYCTNKDLVWYFLEKNIYILLY